MGKKSFVFGSSPSADMVLTDKTVSRRHLQASWGSDGGVLKLLFLG